MNYIIIFIGGYVHIKILYTNLFDIPRVMLILFGGDVVFGSLDDVDD